MKSYYFCFIILLFISKISASEDTDEIEIYKIDESNVILKQHNPLESDKELWLNPSDGVLITTNTKLSVVEKVNHTIMYREFTHAITHIVRYSRELQAADARLVNPIFNQVEVNDDVQELTQLPKGYPTIVYPEIIVVVAYDLYRKFELDPWKMIPYLLSFWNSVDMRYRFLENPRYRLNIKQFILEKQPGTMNYIRKHINSTDYLAYNSLQHASKFWFRQRKNIRINRYDLVVTMTNRQICGYYDTEKGECKHVILGHSYYSGACQVDRDQKETKKVAIIYDNGAYHGITIAAHEIGHLLGAYDDGYRLIDHNTNTLGPMHCTYKDAFVMTPIIQSSANIFLWSKCSREDMEKFIKNESSLCLRNKPKGFNYPVARFLPGKLMDADLQCRRNGAMETCGNVTSTCTMLQCYYPEKGCVESNVPIADGTACDTNSINDICLYGQCVSEQHLN